MANLLDSVREALARKKQAQAPRNTSDPNTAGGAPAAQPRSAPQRPARKASARGR